VVLVDVVCKDAEEAFKSWSNVPAPVRGELIYKVGALMRLNSDELAKTLMNETGKTLEQAHGEVRAAVDMAFFIAGEGRRLYGDTTNSELPNRWAITKRCPIGVCAIIVPWNFPLSLAAWKVLPALVCGNTVVLKQSKETPQIAVIFERLMREAGFKKEFNVFSGSGEELVSNKRVKMVSFTGSTEIGRKVAVMCAQRLTKVSLELGGKNAAIVMDDADIDLAVDGIIKGAFSFGGQRCSSTSRVIVHEKVHDIFMERLCVAVRECEPCRFVSKKQIDKINDYIAIGISEGAKLVCADFQPIIFDDVKPSMRIAQEEIFGLVLSIIKVKSFDEAIEVHNGTNYGLTASIFTRDVNTALAAIDRMDAGVCYVNAPTFGSEVHLPFGGTKDSGNGSREVGMAAIDTFTEWKTIYLDYSGAIQNAQFKTRDK
jgi:aldehyde dehydrogenase (NAD+)